MGAWNFGFFPENPLIHYSSIPFVYWLLFPITALAIVFF
jgi:hypothetical protein